MRPRPRCNNATACITLPYRFSNEKCAKLKFMSIRVYILWFFLYQPSMPGDVHANDQYDDLLHSLMHFLT